VLTALQLANFKAFAAPQRIPIRPLTLIFGPNSAGKSSVIHGLVFGRQAQDTGDLDIYRTTVGGEAVDLGGFGQYIYGRDESRRMEWACEIDTSVFTARLAELFASATRAQVSMQIALPRVEQMQLTLGFDPRTGERVEMKVPTGELVPSGAPQVQMYEFTIDSAPILRVSKRPDGSFRVDRLFYDHPAFREVIKSIILTSTTTETVQTSDYEGLDEAINQLVPEFSFEATNFLPEELLLSGKPVAVEPEGLIAVSRGARKENLSAAVRLYFPRLLDEMIRGISEAITRELKRFQYLGPLRSYPPRHIAFSQQHDPNWFAGGGYAWDVVRRDVEVREKVNHWLGSKERLQTPYALVVRELVGIDDLEPTILEELNRLEQEGIELESEPDSEHTVGGVYPVIDPEAEARNFQNAIRAAAIEKIQELILFDRRTETIVTHRDVGIGISQVLPVLVAAYASKDKILAMEQPEIHLHPALQAELGDVFIASALGEQKNTFILETHSEHLILRILRRIRETTENTLPEGSIPVLPRDVAVLYVLPTKGGSIIKEIPVLPDGEFAERWPEGFFPERAKELF
jgi:hypothetical protein